MRDKLELTINGVIVPAKYVVCDNCQGRGELYLGGRGFVLTAEDFAEDPDLREDIANGTYNQTCVQCNGKRVVKVPDLDRMNKYQKKIVRDFEKDFFEDRAERASECFDLEGRNLIRAERIRYERD